MAKKGCSEFFPTIFPKKTGQKWPFQIFSDNFSQKVWFIFGMAKIGHSEFFLTIFSEFFPTIFPEKTGINLEWPKWLFQIFSDNFSQKDWYKFKMAKNGCSKLFLTIFPKKTGTNLEWPKMAILNVF